MRHHIIAAAFLASLLIDAAAFAAPKTLENIPLKWTPTTTLAELGPVDLSGAMLTAKIHFESLVDTRQNPTLIAENREKPDKVRTVTTSSDVAGFVNEHLQASLRSAGLNIVEGPADIVVSGEIRQFFVTEVNTYNGGYRCCCTSRTRSERNCGAAPSTARRSFRPLLPRRQLLREPSPTWC